jgi:hypothetical protein
MEISPEKRSIDLRGGIDGAVKRSLFRLIEKPVESVLSLSRVNRLYAASLSPPEQPRSLRSYFGRVLEVLNIRYQGQPQSPSDTTTIKRPS